MGGCYGEAMNRGAWLQTCDKHKVDPAVSTGSASVECVSNDSCMAALSESKALFVNLGDYSARHQMARALGDNQFGVSKRIT